MSSKMGRTFFVTLFVLAIAVFYSTNNTIEAGKKNTSSGSGWNNWNSDDGNSDGKSHDDGSSGHKPKEKKPKKHWKTDGNANIDSDQHFLGTTDPADLVIKTNNTEKARVTIDGDVGIGTASPTGTFHVDGGTAAADTDGKDVTIEAQDGGPTTGAGGNIVLTPGTDGDGTSSGTVYVGKIDSLDPPVLSLDVNGQIRIRGGSPFLGAVLTSDSFGNATWQSVNVNDADSDPANELQTLSQTGNNVTLSLGGGTVTVADNDNDSSNELQVLNQTGNNVTLSNGGGTVSVDDGDSNSTNELQSLSSSALNNDRTIDISSGTGTTINVADNDDDSTNELNTGISFDGTSLTVTDAGGNQTVDISGLADDADPDPTNELNTAANLTGTDLNITDAGSTLTVGLSSLVNDADADPTNERNTAANLTGTDLNITDSGGTLTVGLSSLVDDADADAKNELNTSVALVGSSLEVTDAGGTKSADLSSLSDTDWTEAGSNIYRLTGNIGIGTPTPGAKLDVAGQVKITGGVPGLGKVLTSDASGLASWETIANDGDWTISGSNMSSAVSGNVGIGTGTTVPESLLTLASTSSNPTLAVTPLTSGSLDPVIELHGELPFAQEGFAIRYDNTIGDVYFNQIYTGITGSTPAMRFSTGNAADAMVISANGNVGVGTTSPLRTLDVWNATSGATNNLVGWATTADSGKGALLGIDTSNRMLYFRRNDSNDYGWQFQKANGTPQVTIHKDGNVGIGTTSPISNLVVKNPDPGWNVQSNLTLETGDTTRGRGAIIYQLRSSFGGAVDGGLHFAVRTDSAKATVADSKLFIRENGSVGIGTTEPGGALTVEAINSSARIGGALAVGQATGLQFADNGTQHASLRWSDDGIFQNGTLVLEDSSAGAGANSWFTNQQVNFEIRKGNGKVASGFQWLTNSDRRYKKNISKLDNSLDKVMRLRGVRFDLKEEASIESGHGKHVGVIAQELEGEYPELVVTDEETGYKAVAYDKLTAILIEAVKELKAENDELRDKFTTLADKHEAIVDMLLASSTELPKEKLASLIGKEKK